MYIYIIVFCFVLFLFLFFGRPVVALIQNFLFGEERSIDWKVCVKYCTLFILHILGITLEYYTRAYVVFAHTRFTMY